MEEAGHATVSSGRGGAESPAVAPDGSSAYVSSGFGNEEVPVLDTETDRITGSTTVGTGPMSVAVEAEPSR